MNTKKILFLNSSLSFARYRKRIRLINDLGVEIKIMGFERNSYKGVELSDVTLQLGYLDHGNYFKRLMRILLAIKKVRQESREVDIIYSFGLDMAVMALLSLVYFKEKPKLVFEVGDIREILLGRGVVSWGLRILEKNVIKRINLLVVTSRFYISEYYNKILRLNNFNFYVLENKVSVDKMQANKIMQREKGGELLRIGYFGVLRCKRSLKVLMHLVNKYDGLVEVYLRGVFKDVDSIENKILKTKGIVYEGPYKNPDDLTKLYSYVDIIWAIAKYNEGEKVSNLSWARSNRYYESCFYKKPIIAQVDTQDGIAAEKLDIGIALDISDIDKAVDKIMSINKSQIERWKTNLSLIPENEYILIDDHKRLLDKILNS